MRPSHALVLVASLAAALAAQELALGKGNKIVFLGDSITHQGQYVEALETFFLTVQPELQLRFFNAGIGGDRVPQAAARLEAEVIAQKPDLVTILLGMNDAGYKDKDARLLAVYEEGLLELVGRIQKGTSARVLVMGPTFFDALSNKGKVPLYNDVLLQYTAAAQRVAAERKALFFDPNEPMRQMTESLRKSDPKFTLSPDGVHPDLCGGFAVACAFVDHWIKKAPVVELFLTPTADGSSNEHKVTIPRLPCPVRPEARRVADLAGFEQRYNRFVLKGVGIGTGKLTILADGQALGTWQASELMAGVELTQLADTPWARRGAELLRLAGERRELIRHQIRAKVGEIKGIKDEKQREEAYAKIHARLEQPWAKVKEIETRMRALCAPFEVRFAVNAAQ